MPEDDDSDDPVDELASRRAFEADIAAHRPALQLRARQLCRSHDDPEDLVQDALERALRTRRPANDATRVRAWMLRILTNCFIDRIRSERRRPRTVELPDMPAPEPGEAAPWEAIDADTVRRAVDELPDDVRDTYRMAALEGQNHAAIAEAQRIERSTVGSRVFRARKLLRDLLTKQPVKKAQGRGPR